MPHGRKIVKVSRMAAVIALALLGATAAPSWSQLPEQGERQRTASAPNSQASLDLIFVHDDEVKALLVPLARRLGRRISEDGSFRTNARGGTLNIENQRTAFIVVAGGVSANDQALVSAGLRAVEWGLGQAGEDGSFPGNESGRMLPRAFFVEAAGRVIRLLEAAPVSEDVKRRAIDLGPKLSVAARSLSLSDSLRDVVDRGANSNQLFVAGAALQQAALISGDEQLAARARKVVEAGLRRQDSEGVFFERGGFDTNYQSVSLEYLARYNDLIADSPWKSQIRAALYLGSKRLKRAISPSGAINAEHNTRTVPCGRPVPGQAELGADSLPLRIHYVSLSLKDSTLTAAAIAISRVGQRFDHAEQCADRLRTTP
jgi:hypothetical protein